MRTCLAVLLLLQLAIAQDLDQARHWDTAAAGHLRGGRLRAAQEAAARALAQYEGALGDDHLDVAAALDRLGNIDARLGEYRHAAPHLERALRIRGKALPGMHPDVVRSRLAVGRLYVEASRFLEAAEHLKAGVEGLELMLDEDDPQLAKALVETARVLAQAGDDKLAEGFYLRAIKLHRGPVAALLALELAGYLARRGDFDQGVKMATGAAAYMKRTLGEKSLGFARAANAIGSMYHREGRDEEAYRFLTKAAQITLALEGKHDLLTASIANNIASCLVELQKYETAEKFYRLARRLLDGAGQERAAMAAARNLARLRTMRGDYKSAAELLAPIVAHFTAKYPPEHPELLGLYAQLAVFYAVQGDVKSAIKFERACFLFGERILETELQTGTEVQRARTVVRHRTTAYRAVSLHAVTAPDDPEALELACAVVLRHKGRLLDAISRTFRAGHSSGVEGESFLRLKGVRSDLSTLILRRPAGMDDSGYKAEVARLHDLLGKLEAEVTRARGRSTTLTDIGRKVRPITAATVQESLPDGAVLADFLHYRPFNHRAKTDKERWGEPRYVVYIVRKTGPPLHVDLGETRPIDDLIGRFRRSLADPRSEDVAKLARRLDSAVFEPVRARANDARTVFVSPDGALGVLPFAALVDAKGRFVLETHRIHYLMSGREAILPENIYLGGFGAPVVIADPDFDREAREGIGASSARAGNLTGMRFGRLPGTAGEADALRALFPDARVLTRGNATETALKQVKSPRILHIATHGFFLEDLPRDVVGVRAVGVTKSGGSAPGAAMGKTENPLLRSGVALAGANRPRTAGGEDGIVTALELASLDLTTTKLAVLSACETGIGEIRNGDGVHGLRRALAIAGAESQMISLWKVHDEATRDLMVGFYKRLSAGESRIDALRNTQLEMLRGPKWGRPFFWAAFIVSGNWKPLP